VTTKFSPVDCCSGGARPAWMAGSPDDEHPTNGTSGRCAEEQFTARYASRDAVQRPFEDVGAQRRNTQPGLRQRPSDSMSTAGSSSPPGGRDHRNPLLSHENILVSPPVTIPSRPAGTRRRGRELGCSECNNVIKFKIPKDPAELVAPPPVWPRRNGTWAWPPSAGSRCTPATGSPPRGSPTSRPGRAGSAASSVSMAG
jgi:hypothetical protein